MDVDPLSGNESCERQQECLGDRAVDSTRGDGQNRIGGRVCRFKAKDVAEGGVC